MHLAFIIEDHKDTAQMLEMYLESKGIAAVEFDNFDDAFAAMLKNRPCIALIDLNVPGTMDAKTFIAKAKEHFPNLPMILVSGDPKAKLTAESVKARFIMKPFSLHDIVEKVKESCPSQP
jgi:DNA-binding NtrC family response regulator